MILQYLGGILEIRDEDAEVMNLHLPSPWLGRMHKRCRDNQSQLQICGSSRHPYLLFSALGLPVLFLTVSKTVASHIFPERFLCSGNEGRLLYQDLVNAERQLPMCNPANTTQGRVDNEFPSGYCLFWMNVLQLHGFGLVLVSTSAWFPIWQLMLLSCMLCAHIAPSLESSLFCKSFLVAGYDSKDTSQTNGYSSCHLLYLSHVNLRVLVHDKSCFIDGRIDRSTLFDHLFEHCQM